MNPQAIIAAIPWMRRAWRLLPPPARVPVLLVAAAFGVWQFVNARRSAATHDTSGAARADGSLPARDTGPFGGPFSG